MIEILCSSGPKATVNHPIEEWFPNKIHCGLSNKAPIDPGCFPACLQGPIDGGDNMGKMNQTTTEEMVGPICYRLSSVLWKSDEFMKVQGDLAEIS